MMRFAEVQVQKAKTEGPRGDAEKRRWPCLTAAPWPRLRFLAPRSPVSFISSSPVFVWQLQSIDIYIHIDHGYHTLTPSIPLSSLKSPY